uniref:Capsid protein n=1 Tax=Murid herpesvirus 4 TaxID=33708 RepID=C9DRI6_MHV68|nr:capsid protein [Murid gammaherpesvirus 4]
MASNRNIVITLTSRLYADEISALQEMVGAVICLQHYHQVQDVASIGLGHIIRPEGPVDWIAAFHYLRRCTFGILHEINPDSISIIRVDPGENYQIKNTSKPYVMWDEHDDLAIIPPIFGVQQCTIKLDSNNVNLVFPSVVPAGLAQMGIQKILMYNLYSNLLAAERNHDNVNALEHYTRNISYMGRTYNLDAMAQHQDGAMAVLDDVAMCTAVLAAIVPEVCNRVAMATIREGQHPLVEVFADNVPMLQRGQELNVEQDIMLMGLFMAYTHKLGSIFNLSTRLCLGAYSHETKIGTCWL